MTTKDTITSSPSSYQHPSLLVSINLSYTIDNKLKNKNVEKQRIDKQIDINSSKKVANKDKDNGRNWKEKIRLDRKRPPEKKKRARANQSYRYGV